MKMWLFANWFKLSIATCVALAALAVAFHFFVSTPREHARTACIATYVASVENVLADIYVTPAQLCDRGYAADRVLALVEEVKSEFEAKYANPDDPWVKEQKKNEFERKIRSVLR